MKKKKSKPNNQKLKFSTAMFKGSYIYNPLLTQLLGLCPIIAVATNFINGFYISIFLGLTVIICEVLTSLIFKRVARFIRVCLYMLISAAVILPIEYQIDRRFPLIGTDLGIYLILLTVNSLTVIRCEKFACKTTVRNSFFDAIATFVGFGAVTCTVGLIREFLSDGTLFSFNIISAPRLSAMSFPFGALLILGFLSAFHKWTIKRFFPKELTDTFGMDSAFEKPAVIDPGIYSKNPRKKSDEDEESFPESIMPRYSVEDIDVEEIRPSTKDSKENEHFSEEKEEKT